MAWPTMHFATGMACSGALGVAACLVIRRGWRLVPPVMTLGGLWACVPDMPRLFRIDFPSLPLSGTLGSMYLERWLHHWGNVFFLHRALDEQPRELALPGLFGIILLYNAAILGLLWLEHRQRNSAGNRWWRAHGQAQAAHRFGKEAGSRGGPQDPAWGSSEGAAGAPITSAPPARSSSA